MNQSIQFIPQINQKLEQFKLSIDVLINQNNEYLNSVKRYENKEFEIEKKENQTLEEQKNKAETMLDQLEDIDTRINLEIHNVQSFENKMNEFKSGIEELKTKYLNDKNDCKNKMKEIKKEIFDIFDIMEKDELKQVEEQRKTISSKYKQMREQFLENETFHDILNEKQMKQLEQWTSLK